MKLVCLLVLLIGCGGDTVIRTAEKDTQAINIVWQSLGMTDEPPPVIFIETPDCYVDGLAGFFNGQACTLGITRAKWETVYPYKPISQEVSVFYESSYSHSSLTHELLHAVVARTVPNFPNSDPGHTLSLWYDNRQHKARDDLRGEGL